MYVEPTHWNRLDWWSEYYCSTVSTCTLSLLHPWETTFYLLDWNRNSDQQGRDMKKHSNFSWCPLPLFEQLPNVGLQAFKEEIILSTTWKQSLISHEMKAPLIYTCNATVSYSCWCEKKWSLILDLIFMRKFCSSLSYTCPACMTRQHLLKPSTSSEATLNKQQRAQHWRKIVLTNMCDHKTQFSCRSAGGKTQNKISTVRFLIAASFLKKMIAYQVVRYLYSLNILEMTYCNKHHIK